MSSNFAGFRLVLLGLTDCLEKFSAVVDFSASGTSCWSKPTGPCCVVSDIVEPVKSENKM